MDKAPLSPLVVAVAAAAAFAIGSFVVSAIGPDHLRSTRAPTTFFAVAISLSLTSIVVARWGSLPLWRTMARTVGVGVAAMLITFAIGSPVGPSPVARRPSPVARRPSPVARRPSPVARRPSPVARRPSPVARRPVGMTDRRLASVSRRCHPRVGNAEPVRRSPTSASGTRPRNLEGESGEIAAIYRSSHRLTVRK